MTCGYCGSRRYSGEARCRKCGCKADDTLTSESPAGFTEGNLAAQPRHTEPERQRNGQSAGKVQTISRPRLEAVQPAPVLRGVPRQGPLFEDSAPAVNDPASEPSGPKVVSIAPTRHRREKSNRPQPAGEVQGHFDFTPQTRPREASGMAVDARIYSEYPVATPTHRIIAAVLDWAVVLAAYALFLIVARLIAGSFALQNPLNLAIFAGVLALIGIAYGLLWTVVARADSAGTRWAQLRVITFDGDPPEPAQRLCRLAGSCLSICTVVGLLWSLADEESLTWQDHMSGTFPTPLLPVRRG